VSNTLQSSDFIEMLPILINLCLGSFPKRHYKVRNGHPGTFRFSVLDNGVTSDEFWTIVGAADDLSWAVFHYAGAAGAVGQVSRHEFLLPDFGGILFANCDILQCRGTLVDYCVHPMVNYHHPKTWMRFGRYLDLPRSSRLSYLL
jgi:hypothetical protein